MKDNLSYKNDQRIKEYLLSGNINNEDLYRILTNNKQTQLYNSKVFHFQNDPTPTIKNYDSIFPLHQKVNNDDERVDIGSFILKSTEDQIFKQITSLKKQGKRITEQLQIQNSIIQQRNILLKAYQNQQIICEQANQEQQTIIKTEQLERLIIDEKQIKTKIQLIQLHKEKIDQLYKIQQDKEINLLRMQAQINKQQQQKIKALKFVKQVQGDNEKIKQNIRKQEQILKNCRKNDLIAQQFINSLKQRIEMETYLKQQQEEKLEFMNILNKFNSNYKRIKQCNKKLQQKIIQKEGKNLTMLQKKYP